MFCDEHMRFEHEVAREKTHLHGVYCERGEDGLIAEAADQIVKLRRLWGVRLSKSISDFAAKCATYTEEVRLCGRPASRHDARWGGMFCDEHESLEAQFSREKDRLRRIRLERGVAELIELVAYELVLLGRLIQIGGKETV
jgi:hypothetical protein